MKAVMAKGEQEKLFITYFRINIKSTLTSSDLLLCLQIGFKTPLGVLTIAGLHVLPVWLYGYQHGVLSSTFDISGWFQGLVLLVLIAGRLLCMSVEVSIVSCHVQRSIAQGTTFSHC